MSKILYLVTDFKLEPMLNTIEGVECINADQLLKEIQLNIESVENEDIFEPMRENGIEFNEILNLIKEYEIIFLRGLKIDFKYHLNLRLYGFIVLSIVQQIRLKGYKYIIFHTGINHHLNFIVFEIAARILKIPQIFLYNLFPSNKLLPLVQIQGIKDREPLGCTLSEYSHEHDIAEYGIPIQSRSHPGVHPKPTKNLFTFVLFSLRNLFGEIIYKRKNLNNNSSLFYEKNVYFVKDIKIAVNHFKAINYLAKNLRSDIRKIANSLDKITDQNSILFFAHLQPEATSFPEAWENANLIDAIIKIRQTGFDGQIYFKEHFASYNYSFSEGVPYSKNPTRVGLFRSIEFYQQLKKLNCTFLDESDKNLYSSIYRKSLVATLTGTIALERALEGEKTLVLGYPWFKHFPTIITLDQFSLEKSFDALNENQKLELAKESKKKYLDVCNFKTISNPEEDERRFEFEMRSLCRHLNSH